MKKQLSLLFLPFLLISCGGTKVVPVEYVTLAKPTENFYVGESVQLTATVYPENATDKTVTYQSSDTSKATINESGLVSCVSEGDVIFTVTTNDGQKTDTISTTIKTKGPAVIHVTSVSLVSESMDFIVGEKVQLTANVFPENATDKRVTYSCNDETVATIDENGLVSCLKEGNVQFTATSVDGAKTGNFQTFVTAKEEPTTVTDELTANGMGINDGHSYKDYTWTSSNKINYAFNAMYNDGDKVNRAIQIRSKNSNSGIIVTGNDTWSAKSIKIEWNTLTDTGTAKLDRYLSIYGSNTAYSSVSDLYDDTKSGSLLTSLHYDDMTEYTFTTSYKYIGLRSSDGAVYLNYINIVWEK